MITADYNQFQLKNLPNAEILWEIKEKYDWTIIKLANELNSKPEQVESWLAGYVEISNKKLNSLLIQCK